MLALTVGGRELYNEETRTFFNAPTFDLELEHSLVSLSKWESEFQKPFLTPQDKTEEETLGYIRCMIVTPDFPPEVFSEFTAENFETINAYIENKMTATWFNEEAPQRSRETITSELIYYWMIAFSIPMECETWHLNRLFALIRICNVKNSKPKKVSPEQDAAQRRELNAKRQAQYGTRG